MKPCRQKVMTEPHPDPLTPDVTPEPESATAMPRWVPVVIGAILVALASLAIYTGLNYRENESFVTHVRPRPDRESTPAPPGEPGAGASLVLHGEGGENTPAAGQPVQGRARAVITGGPGGIQSTVRIWARRGMMFDVTPPDTMVYVNDLPIGEVRQFDTPDEVYDFAEPGSYTVKLVTSSGAQKTYIVTAADDAPQELAKIVAKL
jgi:hypothetical protein